MSGYEQVLKQRPQGKIYHHTSQKDLLADWLTRRIRHLEEGIHDA
jgi:hypothetical protein